MLNALFGKKLLQTQLFDLTGKRIPVTKIEIGPTTVMQLKTDKTDGYWALQLGFGIGTNKNITKPLLGHFKKAGKDKNLPRFLREIRLIINDENKEIPYKVGDQITVGTVLQVGDKVSISGISKAKGFAGGVKRHGFAGGPRTHGQSDRERAPGSIGQTTTPGRVYKGKRMAGRMGGQKTTISGLQVVGIDTDKNIVLVKGLVPGRKNMPVLIQKSI